MSLRATEKPLTRHSTILVLAFNKRTTSPLTNKYLSMAPIQQATRAQIVTLKAVGKTNLEVHAITGIKEHMIRSIYSTAILRGFDPAERPVVILNKHVEDGPRPGRPSKQTSGPQQVALAKVQP